MGTQANILLKKMDGRKHRVRIVIN